MKPQALRARLGEALKAYQVQFGRIRLEMPALDPLAPAPPPLPAVDIEALLRSVLARPDAVRVVEVKPRLPVPAPVVKLPPVSEEKAAGFKFPRKPVLAAFLVAAFVGGLSWRWQASRPQIHTAYPLPYGHAAGLAMAKGTLYSVDRTRQLLFAVNPDGGKVKDISAFPNSALAGLAWGGSGFWSADARTGRILLHNQDLDHTVARAFSNPDRSPGAVYWDGASLWASDERTETVYQYSVGSSLALAKQYTLPGLGISGLHIAENKLWAADAVTRKIYRYSLDILPVPQDVLDLSPWLLPNSRVTGFVVDGPSLWFITDRPAQLHKVDLNRVVWLASPKGRQDR